MAEQYVYKRNKTAGMYILGIVWTLVLLALVLLNVFIDVIAKLLVIEQVGLQIILSIVLILVFFLATLYSLFSWDKLSVAITKDALLLQTTFKKKRLSYRNISSVEVDQSFIGEKYNFGAVRIKFLLNESSINLSLMQNPNELSEKIKAKVTESSQSIRVV